MAKETISRVRDTRPTKGSGESQHSHWEYGSTRGRWDEESGSDFVVTSVNVPDRLDTQEVRARAAEETQASVSRFHREDIMRAAKWLGGLLVLAAVGVWGWRQTGPIRAAISPAGIEASIGRAIEVPVSVASTELRFSPTPRLVITGVAAQSGWRLPEVSLHFNWRDVLQGSTLALGEARVAPVALGGEQAMALLQSVRAAARLPEAVTTIRFESLTFPDLPLLPGRYEAVLRRDARKDFAALSLKRLDSEGSVDIELVPPPAAGGAAGFALFARKWVAGFGPALAWSEATAQGEFRADRIQVDSFSLGAPFGNLNGSALLARDGRSWRLTGSVRSPNLSLEELSRFAGGLSGAEAGSASLPLQGTAKVELALAGSGASVQQALARARASGPVSVSGAALHGLNLGLAVSQGEAAAGAGGVTRFSDFDGMIVVSPDGPAVPSLSGRAGSLRVQGSLEVDRSLKLAGTLQPEVSSPRGRTSVQIRLGGRLTAPTFR